MTRERSSEPPGLVNVKANDAPEWQASGTNNFGVLLTLGKFYDLDPGAAALASSPVSEVALTGGVSFRP